MEKNTVFKRFSEESFRLINQTGVSHVHPAAEGNETFNCNWDGAVAPDGYFYFSLSSENGRCDHAKLMRWKKGMEAMEECYYAADYVIPQDRHIPHSKLHTSINFIPHDNASGYQVIAVTHSTDRAKQHTEWMPLAITTTSGKGFPALMCCCGIPIPEKYRIWVCRSPERASTARSMIPNTTGFTWSALCAVISIPLT